MKENRLAQNNEILHNTRSFQRIPQYNVEKHPYTKIQPSSIRFNGVSDGLRPCFGLNSSAIIRPIFVIGGSLIGCRGIGRRQKWYWPLFVNAVNIATVAAWRIHCFVEETPHSRLEFRRQVVLSLLYSERTAPGRAASGFMSQWCDIRFDGVNHSLGRGPQGRCKLCQRNTKNMYKNATFN
ncbi:PiggyBac transposable element-derived protein 3 [Trichinella nelsoni]|uniref:PiggyBac transposable element-derived protein 3 n=1 Tax=Trichinella nelsoni TaxID=6336 RepID=A0A0V0SBT6_9BILA|nr:PiggyBac transposable element-derived protein 3 [Trichinella nelsoni]